MSIEKMAYQIEQVPGVEQCRVWSGKNSMNQRVYIDLPRLNGGKNWNRNRAVTAFYDMYTNTLVCEEDWAGSATRVAGNPVLSEICEKFDIERIQMVELEKFQRKIMFEEKEATPKEESLIRYTGSEKQIHWANKILPEAKIHNMLMGIQDYLNSRTSDWTPPDRNEVTLKERRKLLLLKPDNWMLKVKLNWLQRKLQALLESKELDASTIIDHRNLVESEMEDKTQVVASAFVDGFSNLNLNLCIDRDFEEVLLKNKLYARLDKDDADQIGVE